MACRRRGTQKVWGWLRSPQYRAKFATFDGASSLTETLHLSWICDVLCWCDRWLSNAIFGFRLKLCFQIWAPMRARLLSAILLGTFASDCSHESWALIWLGFECLALPFASGFDRSNASGFWWRLSCRVTTGARWTVHVWLAGLQAFWGGPWCKSWKLPYP